MYREGIGTEADEVKALAWYEKAARQKNVSAIRKCGAFCERGLGTPADPQKALAWYEKAAGMGVVSSQFTCGMSYEYGTGTPKDLSMALYWYEKAAANLYPRAKFILAMRKNEWQAVPPAEKKQQEAAKREQKLIEVQRAETAPIEKALLARFGGSSAKKE